MWLGAAAITVAIVLLAVPIAWWARLRPSNARDWHPGVQHVPTAEVSGDVLTVRNVRNFRYRSVTDFDERWEDRRFDLSRLDGLDILFSHWGSAWLAHTLMSWSFEGGEHLAISIETRKSRSQRYSALAGFFRQYELVYVAADERGRGEAAHQRARGGCLPLPAARLAAGGEEPAARVRRRR
jgi:hypothetical protein